MYLKVTIALILVCYGIVAYSEEPADQLKSQFQKLEKNVEVLEKNVKQAVDSTAELKRQVVELSAIEKLQIQKINELNLMLSTIDVRQTALSGSLENLSRDTHEKTQNIDETITNRSNWYGVAIVSILVLLGGCYWYLRNRNDESEQTLSAQVQNAMDTVRSTEEKIAKSDTALADTLFEILNKLKLQEMRAVVDGQSKPALTDHHLPLKLADEIHRMGKRLSSLPEDTKGLTPLQKSLERLESELSEQGYEIIDHTGMAYTENLSVKARFIPSDDLGVDQKVISKVVVPQVNHKGVMIRMADIEVSIGS
jgi:uncharacterized phage infection (PIP) family protein YhgE